MSTEAELDPELPAPDEAVRPAAAVVVIACGGVLGALARALMTEGESVAAGSWPWATLTVNVSGAFAVGAVMAVVSARRRAPLARLFLCTGVLGGYTTFSALTVQTVGLVDHDRVVPAIAYVAASVLGAVLACQAGLMLVRRMVS